MAASTALTSTPPAEPFVADEPLYEVLYGERKEQEPMGALQVTLANVLSHHMLTFALQNKLGLVVTEVLFILDEQQNLKRRPDVAFVSYPRWPDKTVPNAEAWNVVPDLAVEVISPSNLAEDVEAKIAQYFEAGVRLVWVLYPETGHLHVYDSARKSRILEASEEVDGGDVLAGFRLRIQDLFDAVKKPD